MNTSTTRVGSMPAAIGYHTATLLQNGQVIVTGGNTTYGPGASAATWGYDPNVGNWTDRALLNTARWAHTTTLLANGQVLVVGGTSTSTPTTYLTSAELYDPEAGLPVPYPNVELGGTLGTWTPTGSLHAARSQHCATLLPNGQVLVAGGIGPTDTSTPLMTSELYNPTSGTWTVSGNLSAAHNFSTMTLLSNGSVLMVGGIGGAGTAELYDPATGTWNTTGALNGARYSHTATLLPNGKVLVAGGVSPANVFLSSAELYDPQTGLWTLTGSMSVARFDPTATLLPNGQVLIAGGAPTPGAAYVASVEIYDPDSSTWTPAANMTQPRTEQTATLLQRGQVLFAAGGTSTAEIYTVSAPRWITSGSMTSPRLGCTAMLLRARYVLVAGGWTSWGTPLATAEIYDPATRNWSSTGLMNVARLNHSATLLKDGNVLVAGGTGSAGTPLTSMEIYNFKSGTWTSTVPLNQARVGHTATTLPNLQVLLAGGADAGGAPLASAELFDPAGPTCTLTGSLNTARFVHTATLMPQGVPVSSGGLSEPLVMVAGGFNGGALSSAELYWPSLESWSPLESMSNARFGHTATLMPDGDIVIAGGTGSAGVLASTEVYNARFRGWRQAFDLVSARTYHSATLLPNGQLLVAGGFVTGAAAASVELYCPYLPSSYQANPALGFWSSTVNLRAARADHRAVLLLNGEVLVTGGGSGAAGAISSLEPLSGAELYNLGLGYDPAWQPNVTGLSALALGGTLTVTGTQLGGVSEASGGDTQSSSTNYPIVQLRNLESEQTLDLVPTSWSSTSVNCAPLAGFQPGAAMVTVFANGMPSVSEILEVGSP